MLEVTRILTVGNSRHNNRVSATVTSSVTRCRWYLMIIWWWQAASLWAGYDSARVGHMWSQLCNMLHYLSLYSPDPRCAGAESVVVWCCLVTTVQCAPVCSSAWSGARCQQCLPEHCSVSSSVRDEAVPLTLISGHHLTSANIILSITKTQVLHNPVNNQNHLMVSHGAVSSQWSEHCWSVCYVTHWPTFHSSSSVSSDQFRHFPG